MSDWQPLTHADLEKRWAEEAAQPVTQRAAAVIRDVLSPPYDDEDKEDPVAWELVCLWDDLDKARRHAYKGGWSIGCEGITYRIGLLTVHAGRPTPWEQVQIALIEDGVYQAINDTIGLPYEAPDMARVAEVRASIERSRVR